MVTPTYVHAENCSVFYPKRVVIAFYCLRFSNKEVLERLFHDNCTILSAFILITFV